MPDGNNSQGYVAASEIATQKRVQKHQMTSKHTNALVVEGGAMRSVFSAGLLDGFIDKQFNPFDFYLGVSAGAYNLSYYAKAECCKSIRIYETFATNKDFIDFRRFLTGGHLIDLDWLEQHAFENIPYDFKSGSKQEKPLIVCMTDVETGQPVYIHATPQNSRVVIKASAALPVCYRDFPRVYGRAMTDGGVADGIPVAQAIRMGATKIMVMRARHKYYMKKDTLGHRFIRWQSKHYPGLLAAMSRRISLFQNSLALIRQPPRGIRIIEVCPPEEFSMGRFSRNRRRLLNGYRLGYAMAEKSIGEWQRDG